jgi:hypothetical protein
VESRLPSLLDEYDPAIHESSPTLLVESSGLIASVSNSGPVKCTWAMGINTSAASREISTWMKVVTLWGLTDIAPQEPFLHMSDAVYLVQNLQALWRADRSAHVLAGFLQFLCRDIMAVSQIPKEMD